MTESVKSKLRGREHRLGIVSWTPFSNLERAVLTIASIVCGGCCLWIGDLLGIPREPHFNGSLLLGGAAVSGIIVALVGIAVCMLIGVVIAAFFTGEAALFCCCMGLAFLAVRCGPIRPVLQCASGSVVLLTLAIETAILAAILTGGWFGLDLVFKRMHAAQLPQPMPAPNESSDAQLTQKLSALGVSVIATALCQQILLQTDVMAQTMAGTLISAFAGAVAGYIFKPLSEPIWYWIAPALTGVLGYVLAFLFSDGIAIGDLHGWAGPLARPTPLVYISMGTAGALLGYWCIRRWSQPEEEVATEQSVAGS